MTDLIVLHDCATIQLKGGINSLIDSADQDWIGKFTWRAILNSKPGHKVKIYARRCVTKNKKNMFLHQIILQLDPGVTGDHINGDSLDNRRANLRAATLQQNGINRPSSGGASRFKGVSRWKNPGSRPWRADIKYNRKQIHLGSFTTESEAASAYNEAALRIYGEFAYLNNLEAG